MKGFNLRVRGWEAQGGGQRKHWTGDWWLPGAACSRFPAAQLQRSIGDMSLSDYRNVSGGVGGGGGVTVAAGVACACTFCGSNG